MKDHPIIFSAPMVCALIAGRKTMTRRLAWIEPIFSGGGVIYDAAGGQMDYVEPHFVREGKASLWQKVKPGDRLWVRETLVPSSIGFEYDAGPNDECIDLSDMQDDQVEFWNRRAGDDPDGSKKISPIHMPRWASRLTLIVTATKIARLQSITAQDAEAEGVFSHVAEHSIDKVFRNERSQAAVKYFNELWEKLHGTGSWASNPEVVAISFTVHKTNIDAMPKTEAA